MRENNIQNSVAPKSVNLVKEDPPLAAYVLQQLENLDAEVYKVKRGLTKLRLQG